MPRGDKASARLHRDWLTNLPRLTGDTLTRIAKTIKVAPSTLTRPLREGDDGTSTLHATTIAKIVEGYRVSGPGELSGAPPSGRKGFGEEAAPYIPRDDDPLGPAIAALIQNRDGVVPWTLRTRALELAGYLPGDVVLVDLNGTAQPGDAVCAQVYDWKRGKAETIMRVLERAGPVTILVAKSLETLPPIVVDGEHVVVKGVLSPHRLRG